MATLTSRLIISLQDQVSGPAAMIRRQLEMLRRDAARPFVGGAFNLGRQMEAEARRVQAAAQRMATSLSPAAFGMGALIHATQDYERAFYGVQVSMLADNMSEKMENGIKRNIINMEGITAAAGDAKREVDKLAKSMMMRPTQLMKAWESVGKAGVPYSLDGMSPDEKRRRLMNSQRTLVEMGGEVYRQDPDMPIDKAAEFLHTLGINFKAGTDKFERGKGSGDYDTDIAKITNQLTYIANATKTSPGKLSAGLRQMAGLYGNLGESFSESAALLGAFVQGGGEEVEGGTALKSMAVRFIKNLTSEGRDAWLAAGLNRADFTNETQVSAKRALSVLRSMTDTKMSKKDKQALDKMFIKAERDGSIKSPEFMQRASQHYNKATGAKDQATRDRNQDRLRMAMFAAGNEGQMFKMFRALSLKFGQLSEADREKSLDAWGMGELGTAAQEATKKKLAAGTLTQGQMAVIGEGRHLSRYNALMAMFGTAEDLKRVAETLNNREFTTAAKEKAKDSPYWKWEGAMGQLETALNNLRNSDAIIGFVNSIAKLAEAVASAGPNTQNLVAGILVLATIGAPIFLAVSIVTGAFATLRGALALLGGSALRASAAIGVGAGVAGAGAVGAGAAGVAGAGAIAAAGAAVTPGAAAAAGGAAAATMTKTSLVRRLLTGAGAAGAVYSVYELYKLLHASTLGPTASPNEVNIDGNARRGRHGRRVFDEAVPPPSPAQTVTAAGRAVANGTAPGMTPPTSVPSVGGAGGTGSASNDLASIQAAAQAIPAAVRSAMDQVRAIVASVDLTADGTRVAESFAAGIRAGAPAVRAAAGEALGAAARNAVRGSFSDGGR